MIAAVIIEALAMDEGATALLRRIRLDGRHLALAGPGSVEVARQLEVEGFVLTQDAPFALAAQASLGAFQLPAVDAVALVASPSACRQAAELGMRVVGLGCAISERDCLEVHEDAAALLRAYEESVLGRSLLVTSDSITS